MAKSNGVVTYAQVAGDYRQQSGWVAQGFRSRQMNGIQCADGFHRKGACGVREDRLCDTHNMATPGKLLQCEQYCSLLLSSNPSREPGAKYRAAGFGHSESRSNPLSLGSNRGLRRSIALKHGGD